VINDRAQFLLSFGEPGHANGQFDVPTGIAIDAADRIYVVDSQNRRVQVFEYVGGAADDAEGLTADRADDLTADSADGADGER
jgi:hypothetical protein